jgi:parallel beta-helix repeat protein/predicted outer membrane repeat protein
VYCSRSSPTIANNTITQNSASLHGGGLYWSTASGSITGNRITGNSAPSGGGIALVAYASPTLDDNTITGNRASANGGAIYCASASSATIANNVIGANSAESEAGGIYCDAAAPSIRNNLIANNQASFNAGGISCRHNSAPAIVNNTIVGNAAMVDGGGLYCYQSLPEVSNNIVAFNSSGVFQAWGPPMLTSNCVFNPGGYDYWGMIPGMGDILADPRLDLEHGTLHLLPGSPCIDAGYDLAVRTGWVDMDGEPRIRGAHVDIGADEAGEGGWTVPVVHVSPSGDDANAGTNWAAAKRTVQAGVNAAFALGAEVWVAAGTYTENIVLDPYAYLYGGFAGAETIRAERNWRTNVTILDGGGTGSIVQASGIYGTIDGFTLQNGNALRGGAIACLAGAGLTITNNTVRGNSAAVSGGAIDCEQASVTLTNNIITANTSPKGGAICCYGASPTITNNTIVANGAGSEEGGIRCDFSSPRISNNIVAFNSSGIIVAGTGTAVLRGNNVYDNVGYDYSGLAAGTGDVSGDPRFVDGGGGDFHLVRLSPCFNSGWKDAPGLPPLDMDGANRVHARVVDIGAYELVACPADFDGDTDVDDDDVLLFGSCASGPAIPVISDCVAGDFDGDGDMDSNDFAAFQRCRSAPGVPPSADCME